MGQSLLQRLSSVLITTRNVERAQKKLNLEASKLIQWSTSKELTLPNEPAIRSVVNLMGESIAEGRWTEDKKKRIRDSRVDGTRKLVQGLLQQDRLPSVFVSASAIGIYGDPGESVVEESHEHGTGFLTDVCEEWEAEANKLAEHGVRVVNLRIGIVIGMNGGALQKLVPIFKCCLGGRLGSGRQWMSWIHESDLVSMIIWALENEEVSGPVNATAPNPIRNSEFTSALAKSIGRPALFPAPKFAVRLALGEFANSLFFSQRVVPAVAMNKGFAFQFPTIAGAIDDAINQEDKPK